VLLQRLFDNLAVQVRPFVTCEISSDWRLRLDGLDDVVLHYVLAGDGQITGGGRTLRLHPFSLAIVPARLQHTISSGSGASHERHATSTPDDGGPPARLVAGPQERVELRIACGRMEAVYARGMGLFDLMRELIVLDFSDSGLMRETFERLLDEQRRSGPTGRAMMTALMTQCVVLVFRRLCDEPDCPLPWLDALEDPRLAPAFAAMLDHPARSYSLESLAELAHMSRSAFAKEFTDRFGRTPMAFLRDVRLRRAASLLRETDLPVESIAARVGFSSRSHFSRSFHGRFGHSPTTFRTSPLDGSGVGQD
jgi:AraC-like DNA-binding protein